MRNLIYIIISIFTFSLLFSCASGPSVFSAKGSLDVNYTACENDNRIISFTIIGETGLSSPYLVLNGFENGKKFKKVLYFPGSVKAGESSTIKETFLCNIENMTAYGWEEAVSGYSPTIWGIDNLPIIIK